jgi:YVTN family beta-propeller protein
MAPVGPCQPARRGSPSLSAYGQRRHRGRPDRAADLGRTVLVPDAIELAPTGALAVVIDSYGDQVTLVNTSTHHAVRRINVGSYPVAVAIAP